MKVLRSSASVAVAATLAHAAAAQPAPAFDVASRAWDIATELARENGDPAISGVCGRTFRPFVIPGLRMQNRQEQDVAAAACVAAARSACGDGKLRKSPEVALRCKEFR